MQTLPLYLRLRNQPCLVIGGGEIALRKAKLLHRAGAHLTIVAKNVSAVLQNWLDTLNTDSAADSSAAEFSPIIHCRPYETADLANKRLVIAATDDRELNARVFTEAEARQLLVNVVDQPEYCRFIFPAIIDRSPLIIAAYAFSTSPLTE